MPEYDTPTSRIATPTKRGLLSKDDKTILNALGSTLSAVRTTNLAIPAATVTGLITLTLTEGTWIIMGWANIIMGVTAGVVDIYLSAGQGSPRTLNLAANQQESGNTPPVSIVVAAGTTTNVTVNAYANAACTAQWAGGAGGLGNNVGIRGFRVH